MSAVTEIVSALKTEITTLLTEYKESPFTYNLEANDSQLDKSFGLKVGSASVVAGVTKHLTFDQEFTLDLTRKFLTKKDQGDKDMRSKIELIHTDIETLYKSMSLRAFNVPSAKILLITPLDISAPSTEDNIVTVTMTLKVQYRVVIN
jgi:hypothetical protein